jgi:integrase
MKLGEYISSLVGIDPEFDRWFEENRISWSPPRAKVRIFLDENLPEEFKEELRYYKWFRIVGEGSGHKDPAIYSLCKKEKCLLITSDKDFWNDSKYSLADSPKSLVKSKMGIQRATSIVPYLTPEEVYQMADAVSDGRNGQRDKLLILLLFETGLRVSEALSLTPRLLG